MSTVGVCLTSPGVPNRKLATPRACVYEERARIRMQPCARGLHNTNVQCHARPCALHPSLSIYWLSDSQRELT
jgi:hypothetical protein